ncbi:hypothetical protein [Kaarinaea lacus]
MKTKLISLAAVTSITLFSTMAIAGGKNCDSMKGAHKDMSADAIKEFKDSHSWMFSEKGDAKEKSSYHGDTIQKDAQPSSSDDLVEI